MPRPDSPNVMHNLISPARSPGLADFAYDQATETLQVSPGFAVMYGLPEGTLEISREQWRALVHPDDLPQLDAVARRALVSGESEFVLEFRILRHGEVRWIELRVLISYDQAGRPVRRIGAMIDVTEHKLAEATLAERDAQLALAGKNRPCGQLRVRCQYGDRAFFCRLCGHPRLSGRDHRDPT